MIQMYKEYKIGKSILEGTGDEYFVVDTKDIRGIDLMHPIQSHKKDIRFVSYQIEDGEREIIILEIKYDGDRFYFKPIFCDDYILIMSEENTYEESMKEKLGEIAVPSEENYEEYKCYETYFTHPNVYKDLICDNPLGVYLSSIEPISVLPNKGLKMVDYNNRFSDDLAYKIKRMKRKAQIKINDSYKSLNKIKSYSK